MKNPLTCFLFLGIILMLGCQIQTSTKDVAQLVPSKVVQPQTTDTPLPPTLSPRRKTIAARVPSPPYPTATFTQRADGSVDSATATRDGVTLQVILPDEPLLVDAYNQVQVTLRNDGPDTFIHEGPGNEKVWVYLQDAAGNVVPYEAWTGPIRRGEKFLPYHLAIGDTLSTMVDLYVPPSTEQEYQLSVRASADVGAYGIPIQTREADAAHQLKLDLKVNEDGYELAVTDGLGQPVQEQLVLNMQVERGKGNMDETERFGIPPSGRVAAKWSMLSPDPVTRFRIWVWAPNFAMARADVVPPANITTISGAPPMPTPTP